MNSMICREYVGNFLHFLLFNQLFTINYSLFTILVDSLLLIINR